MPSWMAWLQRPSGLIKMEETVVYASNFQTSLIFACMAEAYSSGALLDNLLTSG